MVTALYSVLYYVKTANHQIGFITFDLYTKRPEDLDIQEKLLAIWVNKIATLDIVSVEAEIKIAISQGPNGVTCPELYASIVFDGIQFTRVNCGQLTIALMKKTSLELDEIAADIIGELSEKDLHGKDAVQVAALKGGFGKRYFVIYFRKFIIITVADTPEEAMQKVTSNFPKDVDIQKFTDEAKVYERKTKK